MTAKTAKRTTAKPAAPKSAAPAVVADALPVQTFGERIAEIRERNDVVRSAFGSIIADGADLYWTARSADMIGSDKTYATEAALIVEAMGFVKSQGSTIKRLATVTNVHGYAPDSAEFRAVRDRGGMAWAAFLTPKTGEVPALTDVQRTALANVARYNDGPLAFVASEAAQIVAGTLVIDADGRKATPAVVETREPNPNDGTGTGTDGAGDGDTSGAPRDVANPVAQANTLARLLLTVTDAEVLEEVQQIIAEACATRLAQIDTTDAENVPA